jgi:hypothetical protein
MAIDHQGEQSLEAEKDDQAVTIDDRRGEGAQCCRVIVGIQVTVEPR